MSKRSQSPMVRIGNELKKFKALPERGPGYGICSGLAYWTGLPAWLFRLTFLLTTFWFGFGLTIYVILWLMVPEGTVTDEQYERRTGHKS